MKIIFLDMDGVLATQRMQVAFGHRGFWSDPDPVGVKLVERLVVDEDEVLFVLSSSWRFRVNRLEMETILSKAGASKIRFHIDWCTTKEAFPGQTRGMEIQQWLDNHPEVLSYVILDDEPDKSFLPEQHLHLIRTDSDNGIMIGHLEDAFDILHGRSIYDPPID